MIPMATLSETELASRLRLAVSRLARRLRQQVGDPLTPSQISALATLERRGTLTMSELATAERVQPPTMTRIAGALREGGYIASETDPDDRRATRLRVTSAGRKLLERSRSRKAAYLAARLRELSPSERDILARAADLLEGLVEEPPA